MKTLIVLGLMLATSALARASCVLVATPGASFGSYNVFASAPTDTATTITYNCTLTVSVTIDVSTGASGSYATRKLTKAGGSLSYNLYMDAARTQIWGNGSSGTVHYGPTLALLVDVVVPVYGRISARQDAAAGAYADTIVVTLNY